MSPFGVGLKSRNNRGATFLRGLPDRAPLAGTLLLLASSVLAATASTQPVQPVSPLPSAADATPNQASQAQDIESLRQLETDYLRAEMENSPALAAKVLAETFVGIQSGGRSTTKADVLKSLTEHQGHAAPFSITETNMREYLFGDTACVTYTKIYTVPGRPRPYSEDLLHIFTKRNGTWHLQVSSPIPEPKPSAAAKP